MNHRGSQQWLIPDRKSWGMDGLRIAAIALAYFLAHQVAFFFPDAKSNIMLFWPAGGIGLAAFLLNPRRLWPALTVAFFIAGVTADVVLAHRPFLTGVGYMTGNMVESLGCAWLILHVAEEFRDFSRVREVLALIAGAVVVNALSSCIGAGTSVLTRGADFFDSWTSWYVGDGLGILIVGPLLVVWRRVWKEAANLNFRRIVEGGTFVATWLLLNLLIFGFVEYGRDFGLRPYVLVVLLAWPAVRFGQRGVTLALVLLFAIAIVSPAIIRGPSPLDVGDVNLASRLLDLQLFLGFMSIVGFLLAAGFAERAGAEELLRENEERFRAVVEQSPDGILVIEPQTTRFLYFNTAAHRQLGYSREQFERLSILDVEAQEPAEKTRDRLAEVVRRGKAEFETRQRTRDGEIRDVHVTAQIVTAQGQPVIYGNWRDITERKRTEMLLKARAELADMASRGRLDDVLQLALNKAEMLTGSCISFFHFVDANQRDLTLQAWSTNTLKNLCTAEGQGRHYPINDAGVWADCCRTKVPVVHNDYASLPNKKGLPPGHPPMVREAVVPVLHNGSVVCMMGVGNKPTDYTPDDVIHLQELASIVVDHAIRLRAEQERNETLARFSGFAEASHYGMGMAEFDGRIVYANPTLVRMLGEASADDCMGKHFPTAYYSQLTASRLQAEVIPTLLRDGHWHGELELLAADGRRVPTEENYFVIRDEHGQPRYLADILTDITERKQAKRQLAEAKEKAEAASAAKSEFLANMSHEIRTPLNGVIGMTGLLLDTEVSDDQKHYAEAIRSSGEALLALVNDILDFSKIEAGKLTLELLDFDLRNLVESLAAPLAMRAKYKAVEFACAVEPDVPSRVRGAPGRLRQILINLAGNAVKFTEQGRVSVQASLISETTTASVIRFTVRDTGIGIPPEHQEMLFQKFTQADASTTRRYGGTGLGLAISKKLTELMGGEIGVNSQPGVGSEFWFTVPLGKTESPNRISPGATKPAGSASPPRGSFPVVHRQGARILVAEDNVVNQEVALGILHKLGLRAEAVADGTEVIEVLRTLPYDLVLMDVQMPEMDGLEATRIIRDPQSLVLNHQIPIIAMTAHAMLGDREHCLRTGMNDYITKPVSPHALVEALNKWLPSENPAS